MGFVLLNLLFSPSCFVDICLFLVGFVLPNLLFSLSCFVDMFVFSGVRVTQSFVFCHVL